MTNKLKDPVFGKIYERVPNSGIFRNEETGMEIKEGWAIANGFKVVEVEPAPKFLFDPNGKMFELERDNEMPVYKRTEMAPRTQIIGYNKAMRRGYTTECTVYPPPPSSMELIKMEEQQKAKEAKVENLSKAIEGMIRTFTNNYSNVFSYSIRDAQSSLRKAINDLL